MSKSEVINAKFSTENGGDLVAKDEDIQVEETYQQEIQDVSAMLKAAGRSDLLAILEDSPQDGIKFISKMDRTAAVALYACIKEMIGLAIQPSPFIKPVENPGDLDAYQIQSINKFNDNKLKAACELSKLVQTRLPSKEQYDPHFFKAGKRFAVPINPNEWELVDGRPHHIETLNYWKNKLHIERREWEVEAKKLSGRQSGNCLATESGLCLHAERPPEPKKVEFVDKKQQKEEKKEESVIFNQPIDTEEEFDEL